MAQGLGKKIRVVSNTILFYFIFLKPSQIQILKAYLVKKKNCKTRGGHAQLAYPGLYLSSSARVLLILHIYCFLKKLGNFLPQGVGWLKPPPKQGISLHRHSTVHLQILMSSRRFLTPWLVSIQNFTIFNPNFAIKTLKGHFVYIIDL